MKKNLKILSLLLVICLILGACDTMTDKVKEAQNTVISSDFSENFESLEEEFSAEEKQEGKIENIASEEPSVGEHSEALSAMELVKEMGIGWNLGNSLDPVDCTWLTDEMAYETAWGNPAVTKELISFVKSQGFRTVRIPVTWKNHMGPAPDYTISSQWLDRVEEVVNWCLEEELYVILNVHHESSWIINASRDYEGFLQQYDALWNQIAGRFADYPETLIFESMNEIGFDDLGEEAGCLLLNKINAHFTQLIRQSGGNNHERFLLLAGYWTDIDASCKGSVLPEDDRVMLSVHFYAPAAFAIAEPGTSWGYQYSWGTEEEIAYVESQMKKLSDTFVSRGIPVIIGEFGSLREGKDSEAVNLYYSTIIKYAKAYGICPVLWDNGQEIDRTNYAFRYSGCKEAIFGE